MSDRVEEFKGPHFEGLVVKPIEPHTHTLIWLHGFTDHASNHVSDFDTSDSLVGNSVKVILLQAPEIRITPPPYECNEKEPAWFDVRGRNYENGEKSRTDFDIEQGRETTKKLIEIIDLEVKEHLNGDYTKIWIGGYS